MKENLWDRPRYPAILSTVLFSAVDLLSAASEVSAAKYLRSGYGNIFLMHSNFNHGPNLYQSCWRFMAGKKSREFQFQIFGGCSMVAVLINTYISIFSGLQ